MHFIINVVDIYRVTQNIKFLFFKEIDDYVLKCVLSFTNPLFRHLLQTRIRVGIDKDKIVVKHN